MTDDPLDELRAATEARSDCRTLAENRWRAAIRNAALQGVQRTEIAKAAGISRERLYQILGE